MVGSKASQWYQLTAIGSRTSTAPTYLLSTFLIYKPSKKGEEQSEPKSITNLTQYREQYDNGSFKNTKLRIYFDDSIYANEAIKSFVENNKDHEFFEFVHFVAPSYQFTDNSVKQHPSYFASIFRLHPLFDWEHKASVVCTVDIFNVYDSTKYWSNVSTFAKSTTKETFGAMTSKFVVPERGMISPEVNDTDKPNGRWLLSGFLMAKQQLPKEYFDNGMAYLEGNLLSKMRHIDAMRGALRLNTDNKITLQFLENFERGIDEVFINSVVDTLEENKSLSVKVFPYRPYSLQQTYFDIVKLFTAYMRWNRNKSRHYDTVRQYLPEDLEFKGDVPIYFKTLYKNSEKPIQQLMKVLRPKKEVINQYKKLQMDLRLIHLIETYKAGDENVDDFTTVFEKEEQKS